MRALAPTPSLVIDTNIVLSAVLGVRSAQTMSRAGARRILVCSLEAASEARLVITKIAAAKSERLERILTTIEIIEPAKYAMNLQAARKSLLAAPASRNGSTRDAHILALAWTYDADIWSHDRDFAGTGWPSWSSANLAAALSEEAAASAAQS
jgi:predicted nucleic acid-binding protein